STPPGFSSLLVGEYFAGAGDRIGSTYYFASGLWSAVPSRRLAGRDFAVGFVVQRSGTSVGWRRRSIRKSLARQQSQPDRAGNYFGSALYAAAKVRHHGSRNRDRGRIFCRTLGRPLWFAPGTRDLSSQSVSRGA